MAQNVAPEITTVGQHRHEGPLAAPRRSRSTSGRRAQLWEGSAAAGRREWATLHTFDADGFELRHVVAQHL
jgi:hypothetical protein